MAVATRPLFRQDLLAEAIDDGGARFVDVLDDSTGVGFRFFESEYSLACGMDGQRDVDAIVAWADTELGLKPKPTEVQTIIAKLDELGYLGEAKPAAVTAPVAAAAPAATAPAAPAAAAPAALGFEPPRSLTMGWDAVDPAALGVEPPAPENPHEVITKPSAKIDLDEPTPLAPPPSTGSGSKPEIDVPVAATSGSNPGIPLTGSSPGIARVGVVSVPAAKAVVPVKPRAQTPTPTAKEEDEESTKIASDEDLAMGVVVAPQSSSPKIPVENVELGHVDRSAPAAAAAETPSGLDLELGSSGASEKAAEAPKAPTEDLGLGVAGPGAPRKEPVSEVSIALADHAAIDASDVRDAVRASQVMKAVNPDDIEALEKEAAAEAAAAKAAELEKAGVKDDVAAAREKKEKAAEVAAAREKTKADKADTYEGRRLPADEKKATAVETADARPSKVKWLLAVALLAAGAALVYNFAIKKNDDTGTAASKSADDIAAEKAAADQAAAAKAAEDKAAADKLAAEKLAAEKAEAERLAAEKLAAEQAAVGSGSAGSGGSGDPAAEKAAADKLAAEKLAAEKLAAERLAAEQAATDAAAAQKLAADKAAADKAAADAAAADKAAADKAAADKATADKAAADKAAADKAAADKAAADKAAADKAAAGGSDADAAREAAKKAARAKARAEAAAREKAEMQKLLEKQRKALEERKKQQEAGGGGTAPAPTP